MGWLSRLWPGDAVKQRRERLTAGNPLSSTTHALSLGLFLIPQEKRQSSVKVARFSNKSKHLRNPLGCKIRRVCSVSKSRAKRYGLFAFLPLSSRGHIRQILSIFPIDK